jgi:hypothetical protein
MKAPAVSVQGAPAPTQSPTSSPTCAHAISGTVKTGDSLRLLNVLLTLHNSKECVVGLMTTGPAGTYEFTDLLPGCYMVKVTNPPGYNSNGKRKKPLTGFLQLSHLHCPPVAVPAVPVPTERPTASPTASYIGRIWRIVTNWVLFNPRGW